MGFMQQHCGTVILSRGGREEEEAEDVHRACWCFLVLAIGGTNVQPWCEAEDSGADRVVDVFICVVGVFGELFSVNWTTETEVEEGEEEKQV